MMEPPQKKVKITDHFRVALKPQNLNVQHNLKKLKKSFDFGKENSINSKIEIITISDDEDENNDHTQGPKELPRTLLDIGNKGVVVIKEEQETKSKRRTDISSQNVIISVRSNKDTEISPHNKYTAPPGIPTSVIDHDNFLLHDIHCEPHYAWESFNYDREQEIKYRSRNYLDSKLHDNKMTPSTRARLIDWLVHIQDSYSLYHEALYMAVKIADQYLMRKTVPKDQLQLLYMTSILISSKFEERIPPVEIQDLLRESGDAYTRKQVVSLECDILSTLNFNIRYPLSYGFLRRFARCTRSDMKALTLARYILESSLLDYEMIEVLESKIAAASLLLALEMLHSDEQIWTETAEFYTGYKQEELLPLLTQLNDMISRPVHKRVSTIRNKYSHEIFMSVTNIAPLPRR